MQRLSSSESLVSDPISPVDPSPPRRNVRETPGTEFFSAVYLDSPRGDAGGTKPLKVRRRSQRIAGIGRAARRRRSTVSLPRTPRSPSLPSSPTRLHRTNTSSTSASKVHHSISQIFLATSPLTMSPPPVPPKPRHAPSDSMASDLHLGLGGGSYDDSAVPGHSPPSTPALSPASRAFARKVLPPTPMTPSRAPPKAAKLLGPATDKQVKGKKVPKKNHFRPLPTQTLVELEKFLGNVPALPPKPALKPKTQTKAVEKVGSGATVRYRGEDGMMWMDVEEELEFAWLLSDAGAVPSPLPEVDQAWGMEAFTSVLAMPRLTKSTKPTARETRLAKPTKDTSFIDFDDSPVVPRRVSKIGLEVSPWSESLLIPPTRGTSRPQLVRTESSDSDASSSGSGKRRKAPPPPLKLKARHINPHLPVVSHTPETGSQKQTTSERQSGKGRIGHPSLTLFSTDNKQDHPAPETPFVRPRRAPIPNAVPVPKKSSSTRPAPLVIPAQPSPRLIPYVPAPTPRNAAYDGHVAYSPLEPDVSFFEPVTPTTPRHGHKRVLSGGAAAAEVAVKGGAWFRKMVGGKRRHGVRI